MLIQTLVVAALVLGCAVYASWTLMPAGLRRRLAQHLLRDALAGDRGGASAPPCASGERLRLRWLRPRDEAGRPGAAPQPIRLHRRIAR